VEVNGTRWSLVAQSVDGRTDVQCRERYTEHLDPRLVKGNFSAGAAPSRQTTVLSVR